MRLRNSPESARGFNLQKLLVNFQRPKDGMRSPSARQAGLAAVIVEKIDRFALPRHSVAVQQLFRRIEARMPDHDDLDLDLPLSLSLSLSLSLAARLAASPSSRAWLERDSICARMNSECSRRIS
jgi:hypothetical protein